MIITRLSGGMGNQMFQYAVGRKLSLQYGVPLKVDNTFLLHRTTFPKLLRPDFTFRNYDLDVYHVAATIAAPEDMTWWQRPIFSGKAMLFIDAILRKLHFLSGWEKSFSFDERVLSLGPNAYLAGFWQSPKYFESIRDVLIKDFTPIELSQKTIALREEIMHCQSVALHVRKYDMQQQSFHGSIDAEYYDKAIEHIASHISIDTVYVFCEDIAWCKANLHFSYPTVFVSDEYAGKKGEGHIMLMSACKHLVIPNSTFSWWAAWLANNSEKIVVVPKQWFQNKALDTKDLFPEGWVRL